MSNQILKWPSEVFKQRKIF